MLPHPQPARRPRRVGRWRRTLGVVLWFLALIVAGAKTAGLVATPDWRDSDTEPWENVLWHWFQEDPPASWAERLGDLLDLWIIFVPALAIAAAALWCVLPRRRRRADPPGDCLLGNTVAALCALAGPVWVLGYYGALNCRSC